MLVVDFSCKYGESAGRRGRSQVEVVEASDFYSKKCIKPRIIIWIKLMLIIRYIERNILISVLVMELQQSSRNTFGSSANPRPLGRSEVRCSRWSFKFLVCRCVKKFLEENGKSEYSQLVSFSKFGKSHLKFLKALICFSIKEPTNICQREVTRLRSLLTENKRTKTYFVVIAFDNLRYKLCNLRNKLWDHQRKQQRSVSKNSYYRCGREHNLFRFCE